MKKRKLLVLNCKHQKKFIFEFYNKKNSFIKNGVDFSAGCEFFFQFLREKFNDKIFLQSFL